MKERAQGKKLCGRAMTLLAAALLVAGCGVEGDLTNDLSGSGPSFQPADNTATLSWEAPDVSIDGQPLFDLAGYRVYFDTTSPLSKASSSWVPVDSGTTFTFMDLELGTTYFAITAVDIAGNESDFSNEGSKTIL